MRTLAPLAESYGDAIREADIGFVQARLYRAGGMRIAAKRLVEALAAEELGTVSRKRVREMVKAIEAFQNP